MIRRRRPVREIPFSFDSFLDIVANVVGIIIRLILVVWVGARSYSSLKNLPSSEAGSTEVVETRPLPRDPLEDLIAARRQDLAAAQARLLEQMKHLQTLDGSRAQEEQKLADLARQRQIAEHERGLLNQAGTAQREGIRTVALTLTEIQQRGEKLAREIADLEKMPPLKQTLRYRTPVSRPVHSEELLFECKAGRVSFIDIGTLLLDVKRGLEDKAKLLQSRWQVTDLTVPVGAFRLRYVLERERGVLDSAVGGLSPESNAGFRYSLAEWELEPVAFDRGETMAAALQPTSEFRQIVDALDPRQTVVTLWVYPDSFALFRQLRDYLYDRDIVVAGRPLPDGVPVASSRRGTVSRGQ